MNDYLGEELYIGDPVVFMTLQYRELTIGRVFRKANIKAHVFPELIFLKERLRIETIDLGQCNRQYGDQLIKITEEKYKNIMLQKKADYLHFFPIWNMIAEEKSEFKKSQKNI